MRRIFALLLLAALSAPARADMLYLNSGEEISGNLLSLENGSAVLDCSGIRRRYGPEQMMKLRLVREYSQALPPGRDPLYKRIFERPPEPRQYPDDGLVTLLDETAIEASASFSTTTLRTARYILRDGARTAGTARFSYLPSAGPGRILFGRTVHSFDSQQFTDDIAVQEGSEYPDYPLYDTARSVKFAMPGVQVGSVVDYAFEILAAHSPAYPFFTAHYFRSGQPSRLERLSISAPDTQPVIYAAQNLKIKPKIKTDDGLTTYIWEGKDAKSLKNQPLLPPYEMYAPAVFAAFKDTWENIRAAFEPELLKRAVITQEMRELAQKLAPRYLSEEQRAEALYNWVNSEIQYQPVPPQDYSYLPTPSDEVFARRAGNALDKPFVLYALMKAAGLKPDFVYVAPSNSWQFMEELPNIRQFSAAECVLNGTVFCPVDEYARYTQPPDWLQGAHGLRVLGANKPLLHRNPENPPEKEQLTQTTVYTLDHSGDATVQTSEEASGAQQAAWRALKDLRKDELDRHFRQSVRELHANAALSSYSLENLEDMTRDIKLRYAYKIDSYALKAGETYMIFKLPAVPFSCDDTAQNERDMPLYWSLPEKTVQVTNFIIPEGWKIEHLPQNFSAEAPGHSYTANYEVKGRSIRLKEEYVRSVRLLEPKDYEAFKRFREQLASFGETWTVITR